MQLDCNKQILLYLKFLFAYDRFCVIVPSSVNQNTKQKANTMLTHLTLKSSNVKTGPIPVSTSSAHQCPSCPFKGNGCYAESGPLAIHFKAVTLGQRGMNWEAFVSAICALPDGQLWRHNQAGDLAGIGDMIAPAFLRDLTKANSGKRGFTYTHKPVIGNGKVETSNRQAVQDANKGGFVVNLSGNTLDHADQLADLAIAPVVVVVPSTTTQNTTTPKGRKVVICPATQKEGVSCATCQLCARGNRSVIIGFPAHGTSKKKADAITHA
jgi:hypothetical protein